MAQDLLDGLGRSDPHDAERMAHDLRTGGIRARKIPAGNAPRLFIDVPQSPAALSLPQTGDIPNGSRAANIPPSGSQCPAPHLCVGWLLAASGPHLHFAGEGSGAVSISATNYVSLAPGFAKGKTMSGQTSEIFSSSLSSSNMMMMWPKLRANCASGCFPHTFVQLYRLKLSRRSSPPSGN